MNRIPVKKLSPPPSPPTSSACTDVVAASEVIAKQRLVGRVADGTRALAEGTLRVGPKHTWHAIKAKPAQYSVLLAGVGGLGAGFMAAGVDPEPYAVGLSALVCGWSTWKAVPELRASQGPDRLRLIGAHILWPAGIASATTAAGLLLGHGGQTAVPSAADIAQAGAQSAVIGSDVPTIVQTVLDVPEGEREQKRFRRWLLRRRR